MNNTLHSLRLAALLAACTGLGLGAALAVASESIEVSIAAGGDAEIIRIDDLAVGESRTLTTDSGRPVTVIREPEALLIDLDGTPYEVRLPDPGGDGKGFAFVSGKDHHIVVMDALAEGAAATWADARPGQRKIVVVRGHADDGDDGGRKVRVIRGDGAADLDIETLLADVESGAGEAPRIIVKRRIVRED